MRLKNMAIMCVLYVRYDEAVKRLQTMNKNQSVFVCIALLELNRDIRFIMKNKQVVLAMYVYM